MGEKYLDLIKDANRFFSIADHMTFTTYPLVNDTKLILTIVENLYNALVCGVDALIQHNYYYKRISCCPSDFEGKLDMFKQICKGCSFDCEFLILLRDLRSLVEHRTKSAMEFSRGGGHVLADREYRLKIVSIDKTKKYCAEAKVFIDKLNKYFTRL